MGTLIVGFSGAGIPRDAHILDPAEYKRCYACHTSWHKSEFGSGANLCKECANVRTKLRRALYPPAYKKAKTARQNANSRNALGAFTVAEWQSKLEEHNNQCTYCGEDLGDKATVDHDIPVSRGGTNYIDNVVPACMTCNLTKYTRTGEEYREGIKI